jgi:hypothetical protein
VAPSVGHLALGIFYVRVGLLTEAEREFQKLIQLNSQSELPRKLLQQPNEGARERADLKPHHLSFCPHFLNNS